MNLLEPWGEQLQEWLADDPALAALWRDYQACVEPARPCEHALERVALLESAQYLARHIAQRHAERAGQLVGLLQRHDRSDFHQAAMALVAAAVLDTQGDLAGAAARLGPARDRHGSEDDAAAALVLRVALGRVLVMQGDEVGATTVLLEGIAMASALGAKQQEAKMLGNLGFLYGESGGQPFEAFTRRALELGREIGDQRLVAHSLCNLGAALASQGKLDEARHCYSEGLPLAEQLGWLHSVALFHAGMGGVLVRSGDVEAGLALYRRSCAWFDSVGDTYQGARLALTVAQHLWREGHVEPAREQLQRCLGLCGKTAFRNLEWQALALHGDMLERQGDTSGALQALRSSLALRQALTDARNAERMRMLELHVEAERARALARQERRKAEELAGLAFRDPLTNLYNRRYMAEAIATELARSRRRGHPCAVALVDADHFKAINDRHGHQAGDEVLCEIAQRLRRGLRTEDVVARWGGEEFCVLLSETDEAGGMRVVERLLRSVSDQPIVTVAGAVAVTLSAGLALRRAEDASADPLLRRADEALYQAKRQGRNRACAHP